MSKNNWRNASDPSFSASIAQFLSIVGPSPAAWGFIAGQVTNLSNVVDVFDDAVVSHTDAKAAAKAATQYRDATRETASQTFALMVNEAYNNPAVTDAMIASAGLEPRDKSRTKQIPQTPIDLLVTPFANGSITLSWKPNGSTYGVTYVIETQNPGAENWSVYDVTNKTKATYYGFAPGEEKWFRVVAKKTDQTSDPSLPASIYSPASAPSLRVAA